MYRKELCLSLLKDSDSDGMEGTPSLLKDSDSDGMEGTPIIKWHKVCCLLAMVNLKYILFSRPLTISGADILPEIALYCSCSGLYMTWTKNGCFLRRGRVFLRCIVVSVLRRRLGE